MSALAYPFSNKHDDRARATPTIESTAVVVTDLVQSTSLFRRLGLDSWSEVIMHHRRSVAVVTDPFGGHIATFTGDGFVIMFPTVDAAAAAAFRLQYALWAQGRMTVRIGVSTGQVHRLRDGHHLGLCIHEASRLCEACNGGEVILSEEAYKLARRKVPLPALRMERIDASGFGALPVRRSPAIKGASVQCLL